MVTIGSFDGLHIGHKQLLKTLKSLAQKHQAPSGVITFRQLPNQLLKKQPTPQLMNWQEKILALREEDINHVICFPFNDHFRNISAHEFIEKILVGLLGVKAIIIGDDFHFGRNRQGDLNLLKQYSSRFGFEVLNSSTIELDGLRVSSSRVRELLSQGELTQASKLLAQPYSIVGRVIKGSQFGRQLGFPTANIKLKRLTVVFQGVFVVQIRFCKKNYWGVANLGVRPAVNTLKEPLLEIYLLDFEGNLYGEKLTIFFHYMLRKEKYFDTIDHLKNAINNDVKTARNIIKTLKLITTNDRV